MLTTPRRRMAGISLVELMVGITVGLVVLWGLSTVYLNSARGSKTTTSANQLNQDMRAVMDIMVNDIRRAGHWGAAAKSAVNPFTQGATRLRISNLGTNRDCIVYSYDATYAVATTGVTPGDDFFGFRLTDAGVLQSLDQANSATLATTDTACANIAWDNVTDPRAVNVTALTFTSVGSQCIAFLPASYKADDATTYTAWTTGAGTGQACVAGASNAPATYPDTTTHSFVETTQVNITLTATSRTDTTLPAQTLTETVLVRNNRVMIP